MCPEMDKIGTSQNKDKSLLVIKEMCDELFLNEIWRSKNPQSKDIHGTDVNRTCRQVE